jgi:putative glutamine amidotransferase
VQREGDIQRAEIDVEDYAARLDGLILQGGADLHPGTYSEEPRACRGKPDSVRDRFERSKPVDRPPKYPAARSQ